MLPIMPSFSNVGLAKVSHSLVAAPIKPRLGVRSLDLKRDYD